jgi:hypothetical protein
MIEKDAEHERMEHLLRQVRPVGTSPQLKDRVTGAAGSAWRHAPLEVPRQVPLR